MASDPFTNFDSDLPFKLLQIVLALLQQKNKTKLIFYYQNTFSPWFWHNFFLTFSMAWHSKKVFWQKHCSEESFEICLPHVCLGIFSLLTSVLHDYFCSQGLPSLNVICILRFPILETQILPLHLWQTTISTYYYCQVITANWSCTSLQN